jgi:coiled-coil and C2 domain-containing protein 2A
LIYKETGTDWVNDLEIKIEKSIIQRVENWRKGITTRWNRLCSRSMKSLLTKFEEDVIIGVPLNTSIQNSKELISMSKVYKMQGHPFNVTFTDIIAIGDIIYNMDIHSNLHSGVEFALAVHCVGYPGRFVSVWIFISSIQRVV